MVSRFAKAWSSGRAIKTRSLQSATFLHSIGNLPGVITIEPSPTSTTRLQEPAPAPRGGFLLRGGHRRLFASPCLKFGVALDTGSHESCAPTIGGCNRWRMSGATRLTVDDHAISDRLHD